MSTDLSASPQAARQSAIPTASRERLVVMLYDSACRFLEDGATAMRAGDIGAAQVELRRGEAIISHLQHTLDMEQGDIPRNLLTIFLFCRRYLNRARLERNPKHVDDVICLLGQLRDAWDAICPR